MNDAQTFEIARARLPNSVFRRTVEDMNLMIQQYGPPHVQNSEQARSRFLAPLFNNIIARFRELFNNTPEALIEGCITAQGRIEYQFRAFGGVTVVFIEIKLMIGNAQERMNAIAQVCPTPILFMPQPADIHRFLLKVTHATMTTTSADTICQSLESSPTATLSVSSGFRGPS